MEKPVASGPVQMVVGPNNRMIKCRMCNLCGIVFPITSGNQDIHPICRREYICRYMKYYNERRRKHGSSL